MNFFKKILIAFFGVILLFQNSCFKKDKEIKIMSEDEIQLIESIYELDIEDYLSLAISVESVNTIFKQRDTSARIFYPLLKYSHEYEDSYIYLDYSLIKDNWVNRKDIEYLLELGESTIPAIPIYKSNTSIANPQLTTLGLHSLFLLSVYKGNKMQNINSDNMLENQAEILNEFKKWWEVNKD